MKYNRAYEMFNDMMNFALRNGMTSYQSDLMHDAVTFANVEQGGEPTELLWVVKSNGCGTWLWNFKAGNVPGAVADSDKIVLIKYDGECWIADFA